MSLTSEYRRITAVFDSPVQLEPGKYHETDHDLYHDYSHGFRVGPVEYLLRILRDIDDRHRRNYFISFEPKKIHVKDNLELARIYSRARGYPVSLADAEAMQEYYEHTWRHGYGYGVFNAGNSAQVLGTVARLIQDFVKKHPVDCLIFDAYEESRIDLYRAMIRRLARGSQVHETHRGVPGESSSYVEFMICFDENQNNKHKDDPRQQYLPLHP